MPTKRQIKELAEFDSAGAPVISFYLNVDGSRYSPSQNVERTHQLIRQARQDTKRDGWLDEADESFERDLDNLTRFIGAEFERGTWRGVVIFACSAQQLWRVLPIGLPVSDKIVIGARTHPPHHLPR